MTTNMMKAGTMMMMMLAAMMMMVNMAAAAVEPVESTILRDSGVNGYAITGEGTECQDVCGALIQGEIGSPSSCMACVSRNGLLNAFYDEPAPVQRLPVREAGLLSAAAYPVMKPSQYYDLAGATPDSPFVSHLFERTLSFLNGYDKDALITVDSGERLPMSTGVSQSLCNLQGNSTTDVGLYGSFYGNSLFRQMTGLHQCSDEPGTADWRPRTDIGFASVSDYATASARNMAITCFADDLDFQEGVASRLMDIDDLDTMVHELFWAAGSTGVASVGAAIFKNASTYSDATWESIRRCHTLTGDDSDTEAALDQDRLQELREAGRLLVHDLSYFETLAESEDETRPTGKSYGSQVFFEVEEELVDNRRSVAALAICLSTLDDSTKERSVRVYTPDASLSAFAVAAWYFRANVHNYFAFIAHIYELHRRDAVMTYAALNTIDPDIALGASTHPLRQLIDSFSDPRYNIGFTTAAAISWPRQIHQFYVNDDNTERLVDDYAAGRFDPFGDGQPNMVWNTGNPIKVATERLGLDPDFWGGDELPEFSVLDMLRRAHALASEQASEYVDRFWPTDADVLEDVGLASFAAYIAAPEAGNMPLTANENGAIRTVAELKEILSSYIYRLLVHAAARHAPFNGQSSVNLVRNPPAMRPGQALPDPTTTYSIEEILSFGPSIAQSWHQTEFVANFIGPGPYSGPMEYADDILEGLGPAWSSYLATPDASGGYMVSPSGDDFVTCQGGRLSPTNIEW